MKTWSYWYPDLMPAVSGCPNLQAAHELLRASQTFFEATRAWKVIEAALPVTAGTTSIPVAPSDATQELARVESLNYDGKDLNPETLESLALKYGAAWMSQTGTPSAYVQITPGAVRLYPVPADDAVTGLVRVLTVKPGDSATGLPDDLAIKYRDSIQAGAKARLLAIPGKPWTDLNLAAAFGTAFDALCGKGNVDAAKSFGRARIASRPSWC